jgi:hypothetical protein
VVHGDRAAVHGDKFLNVNTMHNAGREREREGERKLSVQFFNSLVNHLPLCVDKSK